MPGDVQESRYVWPNRKSPVRHLRPPRFTNSLSPPAQDLNRDCRCLAPPLKPYLTLTSAWAAHSSPHDSQQPLKQPAYPVRVQPCMFRAQHSPTLAAPPDGRRVLNRRRRTAFPGASTAHKSGAPCTYKEHLRGLPDQSELRCRTGSSPSLSSSWKSSHHSTTTAHVFHSWAALYACKYLYSKVQDSQSLTPGNSRRLNPPIDHFTLYFMFFVLVISPTHYYVTLYNIISVGILLHHTSM